MPILRVFTPFQPFDPAGRTQAMEYLADGRATVRQDSGRIFHSEHLPSGSREAAHQIRLSPGQGR